MGNDEALKDRVKLTKKLRLPREIVRHYEDGAEKGRLERGGGYLELIRTQQIVKRYLPKFQADILDLGGGLGVYSKWLAELGHRVHLVDAVPSHIEEARIAARVGSKVFFSADVGDARAINWPRQSFDIVLMLGPLYHLTRRSDRIRALKEAGRVLRPKGFLIAAAISRYASLVDGLKYHFLDDPEFQKIVERDLREGQHRNPRNREGYFTTSFFHHPNELAEEIAVSGFKLKGIYAVEGPAEIMKREELDKILQGEESRNRILHLTSMVETEPTLLGISSHLLAVATPTKSAAN
jgi:SAM-dependent methyltransferase